jgi:hypothetical protein
MQRRLRLPERGRPQAAIVRRPTRWYPDMRIHGVDRVSAGVWRLGSSALPVDFAGSLWASSSLQRQGNPVPRVGGTPTPLSAEPARDSAWNRE